MSFKSEALFNQLFEDFPAIRYAALYTGGELKSAQRENIAGASAGESDKYEELFVNPGILKLASQRGELDCGGFEFVLIKYGNFFQYVSPIQGGHISICFEPHEDLLKSIGAVREDLAAKL